MDKTISESSPDSPVINIFVASHKDVEYPESSILRPIQVGSEDAPIRFKNVLHDDEGDNISDVNPMYCELTAQYWAWKNADADYYGFCHYRRYFDFSGTPHEQNIYGEILDDYIDESTIREYGLDDKHIADEVEGWDVILSPSNSVRQMDGYANLKAHYASNKHLHLKDLRHVYDILCERHPEYKDDADAVLNGSEASFCNMFIMRKDIFFDYCEWLFPLLDEFTATTDMSYYDVEGLRTPGHLAERLLNIYLRHQLRMGKGWKVKHLQCVHFMFPEKTQALRPLDQVRDNVADMNRIVPVVFAADNAYVPMLTTTMYSLLENASHGFHYDLIVLERNISAYNKELMQNMIARYSNATLRFFDVDPIIGDYDLTTSNAHISIETYYRFLIQDALPFYDRIVYLDSDLIVNGDVADLYHTNVDGKALAAVRDLDFLGNLNMPDGKRREYAENKLGMTNPYDYFQAGVLVMNLKEMRKLHSVAEWLTIASDPDYIYNDQDILNQECQGSVVYIDYAWDVMHDCADRVKNIFSFAPAPAYKAYLESRKEPKILHYAGFDKPWKNPWCDFAPLYWQYAQNTPFALQLIAQVAGIEPPHTPAHHERVIAEDSPIRKYADRIAPIGSKQRELLKTIARRVQGKE